VSLEASGRDKKKFSYYIRTEIYIGSVIIDTEVMV